MTAVARPAPDEAQRLDGARAVRGQEGHRRPGRTCSSAMVVALLARGHLLVEGVPGLAKTMAVKTLADAIGGDFKRIQFTPDLVPADLVGTRIYNQKTRRVRQPRSGPVFANLLLADEINRAPAKVQSALLEVMQERQVTIGRETHPVPDPFLVMATQNPIESEGTYPLPEAQVDRFMLKVLVDYPSPTEEFVIVERMTGRPEPVQEVIDAEQLMALQKRGRPRLRRPGAHRVRGPAGDRDPDAGADRPARHRPLHHLRRQPAGVDQPDPRRPGAGPRARPRLRPAPGRASTWRRTCCATASSCPTRRSPTTSRRRHRARRSSTGSRCPRSCSVARARRDSERLEPPPADA